MIESMLIKMVSTYPEFSLFIGVVGALRLTVPVILQSAKMIAAQTENKADDKLIEDIEKSSGYTKFLSIIEWLTSFKATR